jgi:hypothetical protein
MSTHDEQTETAATDTLAVKPKRKYKVTPTPRQRRAARIMADIAMGKRPDIKNSGDIVIQAGYAATNKEQPKRLLNTTGVETALADNGFSPETAKNVVKMILESNDAAHKDRLKAADMVFKVHGTYAAEKHVSLNVEIEANNERLLELAERLRRHA